MRENGRTLPLLFTAPPPTLSCEDLQRLGNTPVVVARGDATRTFYNIAAEWAAACIPVSTLVVVPNARHLLPVEDDTRFTSKATRAPIYNSSHSPVALVHVVTELTHALNNQNT